MFANYTDDQTASVQPETSTLDHNIILLVMTKPPTQKKIEKNILASKSSKHCD